MMTEQNGTGLLVLDGEQALLEAIAPLRARLALHPLYAEVRSVGSLRMFLESHVFAVWDFMSLLKALQRVLTCVEVPWVPTAYAASRRLVNEIVLGEESDVFGGRSLSHFELYLEAMEPAGAGTGAIAYLLERLAAGASLEDALVKAPVEAAVFVRSTFDVIATGQAHKIAAAFTFGREDLIPEMFSAFVRELDEGMPGRFDTLRYYLERHIELDGDEHGPMALAMMRELCVTPEHWVEAAESAVGALKARLALWDGIDGRIRAGA